MTKPQQRLLNLLLLLAIAAACFFIFAPAYVDRDMNRVDGEPLPEVPQGAEQPQRGLRLSGGTPHVHGMRAQLGRVQV